MIPQIDIRSTMGSIGISYTDQQWQIHAKQADLSIQAQQAELSIQYTPGNLQIDQSQAFNQEGLKPPLTLNRDEARRAEQVVLQNIAGHVQWGQRFADLAHHSADLGQYAMRYRERQPQFAPQLIPSPFSVHISYQMGKATVQVQPRSVHVSTTVEQPRLTVQPGTVKTYVEHASSLEITPPAVGQLIDQKI